MLQIFSNAVADGLQFLSTSKYSERFTGCAATRDGEFLKISVVLIFFLHK